MLMKKSYILALTITMGTGIAGAATLQPEAALDRALASRELGPHHAPGESPVLRITHSVDEQPMVYLFSRGDNKGFYAVSADDTSVPLLGFSDNGTLPESFDQLPDGLQYWLGELARQVAFNSNRGLTYAPSAPVMRQSIAPQCATRWNQDAPYNDLCPTVNGQATYTGCAATAMAQVVKYYNYPAHIKGSYSYTWNSQTLSVDESVVFDWDNMLNIYDDSATQTQKTAVATLMRACGVTADMNYGTSASGASMNNVLRGLIENFGYDQGARLLSHSYYTTAEWEDLIYANLCDYGPVLMDGFNTGSGHAFVCDGYKDGLYHFNWGWGGMSDGYFQLTALDPGAQGIGGSTAGYNIDQQIICNLKTDNTSTEPFYSMSARNGKNFSVTADSSTNPITLKCVVSASNSSSSKLPSSEVGITVTSQSGETKFIAGTMTAELDPGWGYNELNLGVMNLGNLSDDTYTIRPAWKDPNGEVKDILYPISSIRMYTLVVADGAISTLTATLPASVSAADFALDSDLYKGSEFKTSATITNTSSTQEFSGLLAVGFEKDNERVAVGNEMLLTLQPGQTVDWEYISPLRYYTSNGSPVIPDAGEYQMYLYTISDDEYTPIAGPVNVTLHDASTPTITVENLNIPNGQNFWDMYATATVKCTSGYFAGTLRLYFFPSNGGTSIASFTSDYICVRAPGSSSAAEREAAVGETEVSWSMPFTSGAANTTYMAAVYYNSSFISNTAFFTTGSDINVGVEEVEVSNDITETEYYTMTGIRLGSRQPVKGIYIVREHHADGTVTTRRVAL